MKCEDCDGEGDLFVVRPGGERVAVPCPRCDGTSELCDVCGEAPDACLCEEEDGGDE